MAISAKRFEFLDNETNVPVSDFLSNSNTGTLNTTIDKAKSAISDSVSSFITGDAGTSSVVSQVEAATRSVKNAFADQVNTANLTTKNISNGIKDLTGNDPIVTALLNKMPLGCKDAALSKKNKFGLGSKINCNGNSKKQSGSCGGSSSSSSDFGKAMEKLTGGSFSYNSLDMDELLDKIINLSSMGYKLDLCGLFSSLSSGVDLNILSKASATLLKTVSKSKDTLGVLDLASGSLNLDVKSLIPGNTKLIMDNLTIPPTTKETEYSDLYTRVAGATEIFDSNHTVSELDGILSNKGTVSNALSPLYKASVMNVSHAPTNLNDIPQSDEMFIYGTMA